MQPRILTVFKEGGDFRPEHVERLRRQCAVHAPGTAFVCLAGPRLLHDWPGWWSKMHVFTFAGPVLYMDLDTAVVGDLTPLLAAAQQHRFLALRNPLPTPSAFGSGLMAWAGDMRHVYTRFALDPDEHMRRCTTRRLWGDQGFVSETETPSALWQDLLPGRVVGWKTDCTNGVPKTAAVVYFHGTPRPWQVGM